MAAWQVRPPRSVTIAAAIFMTGSQSGLVDLRDKHLARLEGRKRRRLTTRTGPAAIFSPTARPVTSTGPLPLSE